MKSRNEIIRAQPARANLLRLFRWHALDNRATARLLGSTPHTVGDWLSGKREPGAEYLLLIAELFAVNPRDLYSDPRDFAERIAERERIEAMPEKAWRERGFSIDEFGLAWGLAVRSA
jgi:transcriptional regulator with XRE-family HTH domain